MFYWGKKAFLAGIFFIFVLMGMGLASCSKKEDKSRPLSLLVYGDSLSAGYNLPTEESFASKLATALYQEGYTGLRVIQMSVSGETTGGGLERLPQALAQRADAVILELGINDFLRKKSLAQAKQNLIEMIEAFQKNGTKVFLAGMKIPSVFPVNGGDTLSKMYEELAQEYKVPLYPFFMEGVFPAGGLGVAAGIPSKNLQEDGVHPTKEGVEIMVKNILPSIIEFLGGVKTEN